MKKDRLSNRFFNILFIIQVFGFLLTISSIVWVILL